MKVGAWKAGPAWPGSSVDAALEPDRELTLRSARHWLEAIASNPWTPTDRYHAQCAIEAADGKRTLSGLTRRWLKGWASRKTAPLESRWAKAWLESIDNTERGNQK